ncbi:unnamed protein product [Cuscuta campestris]|uniref:Uncharacterized protein n=1 Tax=Cuscuta campestris TaxID=132261 RepID=A0A484L3M2_9ASTE|nr:unnamed protein product [Cuscuta campestris]
MGKNFQIGCGRIVCAIMFFLHLIVLLTWRLPHQKLNGKEKSLEHVEEKRFICSYTIGWDSLLCLVENSILHGSKEVALAAINCLHSTIVSQSPKVITTGLSEDEECSKGHCTTLSYE